MEGLSVFRGPPLPKNDNLTRHRPSTTMPLKVAKVGTSTGPMVRINARGEHVVSVIKRTSPNPDGTSTVEAQITLDNIPVPDRRYSADVVFVNYEGDGEAVQLGFGQKALGTEGKLRSVVAVKIYPDHIRKFLLTTDTFVPRLYDFIERSKAAIPDLQRLTQEPAHVVSLVANIIAVGYTAREAVIDLYHFNALALHKLNEGSDQLAVDPVLRVDLPTTLLAGLVRTLNNLGTSFPPETKI